MLLLLCCCWNTKCGFFRGESNWLVLCFSWAYCFRIGLALRLIHGKNVNLADSYQVTWYIKSPPLALYRSYCLLLLLLLLFLLNVLSGLLRTDGRYIIVDLTVSQSHFNFNLIIKFNQMSDCVTWNISVRICICLFLQTIVVTFVDRVCLSQHRNVRWFDENWSALCNHLFAQFSVRKIGFC